MKNRFLLFAAFAMSMMTLSSCNKETEGVTRITYFPTIELVGEDVVVVDKGTEYVEPGYVSIMNGEDVSSGVTIQSNVDTEVSGVYYVNYTTIENEDGFGSSTSRKVIVLDPNDPIEGFYTTTSDSYRDYGGDIKEFGAEYEVLILGLGDGFYKVEDLFGGWYSQRAAYGSAYNCTAIMSVDGATVDVNPEDTKVAGWGDSIDDFHDASYDAATGAFTYAVDYAQSMTFHITLVKE